MPIKPENRHRYPANWGAIRAEILKRADNCCEFCKVRNYTIGQRLADGSFQPAGGSAYYDQLLYATSFKEAHAAASHLNENGDEEKRYIVIVLTIAHLDHVPENCDPANLRALCQKCHLTYDKVHHQVTSHSTRRSRRAIGDLFTEAA